MRCVFIVVGVVDVVSLSKRICMMWRVGVDGCFWLLGLWRERLEEGFFHSLDERERRREEGGRLNPRRDGKR